MYVHARIHRKATYIALIKELAPGHAGELRQLQLLSLLRQRPEREVWRFVHVKKPPDNVVDELLRLIRCDPVLPEQLRITPPLPRRCRLLVPDLLAIPDSDFAVHITRVGEGETELVDGGVEDAVDLDENGGAKLHGFQGVVEGIDGESAAANAGALFKDGDVHGQAIFVSELA